MRSKCLLLLSGLGLLVGSLQGCGGSGIKEPELAEVTGTVTVGGKPYAGYDVMFFPQAAAGGGGKAGIVGGVAGGRTDESGKYVLRYKGSRKGAVVGKNTVQISSPEGDVTGPPLPPIPPEYGVESTQVVEVVAGVVNTFDIQVPGK